MQKVIKTEAEWQAMLSDEQYRITRQHGTEPAFSGAYWDSKDTGDYLCICCDAPLFSSASKYDSGNRLAEFFGSRWIKPPSASRQTNRFSHPHRSALRAM